MLRRPLLIAFLVVAAALLGAVSVAPPASAATPCNDGAISVSPGGAETCSMHGGVALTAHVKTSNGRIQAPTKDVWRGMGAWIVFAGLVLFVFMVLNLFAPKRERPSRHREMRGSFVAHPRS
jgi:hypothetical protein